MLSSSGYIYHLKVVEYGCGVGVDKVITITALMRRIIGVEGGSRFEEESLINIEEHSSRAKVNIIFYRDNVLINHVIPLLHHHQGMHTFQKDNARSHTSRSEHSIRRTIMSLCLSGQHSPLMYH